MFDSQSFNERFRSDFIAAMAAEGALVQPGISTRHPLIHRIFSGSVVVESSLGFESQQSAQIFQARVDGAPTVVFEKMAAYGDIVSDSATFQVLNSDYVAPSDDKTEWYEEAGFFWAAVALGLAMFLCCCFGGLMYCWNWSKANLGDDYRDKETDNEGGMFASLPECPTPACPASLSTCCGLLGKKDQVRFVDCIFWYRRRLWGCETCVVHRLAHNPGGPCPLCHFCPVSGVLRSWPRGVQGNQPGQSVGSRPRTLGTRTTNSLPQQRLTRETDWKGHEDLLTR